MWRKIDTTSCSSPSRSALEETPSAAPPAPGTAVERPTRRRWLEALTVGLFVWPRSEQVDPRIAAIRRVARRLDQELSAGSGFKPRGALGPLGETREITSRTELARALADAHNERRRGAQPMTHREWIGVEVTADDILRALGAPRRYGPEDWDRWSGVHHGRWFDGARGTTFEDAATWRRATASADGAVQVVTWPSKREGGFNASGAEKYVVGFDPKEHLAPEARLEGGAHVGYPFEKRVSSQVVARGIVWVTQHEAFVELIAAGKKTSAGLWGNGQWTVEPFADDADV